MQIEHRRTKDFTCAHCGAVYEMSETPARDTGSLACEICSMVLMKWVDAPIPMFRAKNTEDARRRYLARGKVTVTANEMAFLEGIVVF